MQRHLILRAAVVLVLFLAALVATLALGFVLQSALGAHDAGQAAPASMLGAAVYAPFALVALLLPALAVPIAGMVLAAMTGTAGTGAGPAPWHPVVDAVLLWGGAELLTALLLAPGGTDASMPLAVHLLLAVYAAIAAWLLHRRSDRDDADQQPTPS